MVSHWQNICCNWPKYFANTLIPRALGLAWTTQSHAHSLGASGGDSKWLKASLAFSQGSASNCSVRAEIQNRSQSYSSPPTVGPFREGSRLTNQVWGTLGHLGHRKENSTPHGQIREQTNPKTPLSMQTESLHLLSRAPKAHHVPLGLSRPTAPPAVTFHSSCKHHLTASQKHRLVGLSTGYSDSVSVAWGPHHVDSSRSSPRDFDTQSEGRTLCIGCSSAIMHGIFWRDPGRCVSKQPRYPFFARSPLELSKRVVSKLL